MKINTHIKDCESPWPALDYNSWSDTLKTIHQWTQIVGKIRMKAMPWQNHSWHTTLYVHSRGFTTGTIPFENGIFEIEFDFENHELVISSTFKKNEVIKLYPRSVASFYEELMGRLNKLGIDIKIYPYPNELEHNTAFYKNEADKSYDEQAVVNFWQASVSIHNVFLRFRSEFIGKISPIHFFWGAFDLALTRFSGKKAPLHHGQAPNMPKEVMQEAYSHEVSSCGFWPGSDASPMPAFYSYCYPTPESFGEQKVLPEQAFYSKEMGEFFLLYDDVRKAENPEKMLMEFLQTTYEAAANTGDWDRKNLEKG